MRRRTLLGVFLAQAGVAQAQTDSAWAQVQKRGVLRVAADPTLGLPYFTRTKSGYAGFEWEILQALARQLGVEVRVTEVLWVQERPVLVRGGVDALFNAQEAPDLKGLPILTTLPYYTTSQAIIAPKSSGIAGLTELVGNRVGVRTGSGGAALVDAYNLYKSRGIRPFTAQGNEELLERLERGQLDALVLDTPLARQLVRSSSLKIWEDSLLPIPVVGVVRREEPALKNALDRALYGIAQAGTLELILRRWQLWNGLQTQSSLLSSPKG
ncbi:ABC transporter substrate-binding protein [Anthocerotibacter panamensis]|uniref:ABC transporter substrate-binding protein n=1 Tax=Anthocerotibacter panamensis TaxID=2857077 RepID=UPI001C401C88|nr:ABC transporter substrate-binding protein [Anthocerotibacter panamensis]